MLNPLKLQQQLQYLPTQRSPISDKRIEGCQASPACLFCNRNIYMKMSMEQGWNYSDSGKPNYSDSNLSQWHFVHHILLFELCQNPLLHLPLFTYLSLTPHDVLSCLGNKTTELQHTGGSKYWLAAASSLGSGQAGDLEVFVHWNCGWRSVSNRSGPLWIGCDVRLRCSPEGGERERERAS